MWSEDINTEVRVRNESNVCKTHPLLLSKQTNKKIDFFWKTSRAPSNMSVLTLLSQWVTWHLKVIWWRQTDLTHTCEQVKKKWVFTKKDPMKPKYSLLIIIKTTIHWVLELGAMCIFSLNADNSVGEDYSCSYLRDEKIKAHRKVKMNCIRSDG